MRPKLPAGGIFVELFVAVFLPPNPPRGKQKVPRRRHSGAREGKSRLEGEENVFEMAACEGEKNVFQKHPTGENNDHPVGFAATPPGRGMS